MIPYCAGVQINTSIQYKLEGLDKSAIKSLWSEWHQ